MFGSPWFRLMFAASLAGLLGTLLLAGRLFLVRREAVIALAGVLAFFLIGFGGPFLPRPPRLILAIVGLISFFATVVFIGHQGTTRWAACVTAAVFTPLVLLSLLLGIYVARSTGWQGLTSLGGGPSSDHRGLELVAFVMVAGSPIVG